MMLDDVFVDSYPKLDLHGETRDSARVLVKEFLQDNLIMKNYKLCIVHGIGTGALKDEVTSVLKKSVLVESFHLNHFNSGCMVVYLKKCNKYNKNK